MVAAKVSDHAQSIIVQERQDPNTKLRYSLVGSILLGVSPVASLVRLSVEWDNWF